MLTLTPVTAGRLDQKYEISKCKLPQSILGSLASSRVEAAVQLPRLCECLYEKISDSVDLNMQFNITVRQMPGLRTTDATAASIAAIYKQHETAWPSRKSDMTRFRSKGERSLRNLKRLLWVLAALHWPSTACALQSEQQVHHHARCFHELSLPCKSYRVLFMWLQACTF